MVSINLEVRVFPEFLELFLLKAFLQKQFIFCLESFSGEPEKNRESGINS